MNIVTDPNIPFARGAFSSLGEVRLVPGRTINTETLRDVDVLLVRSVTPVHAGLLDGTAVKFVATATIGTDHVDIPYLKSQGIGFASAEASNANSVAEYVIAALFELASRRKYRLRDKTLGVIGVGNIGSRVVRYAVGLGLRVLQNDPPRQRAEGLPDFVTLKQLIDEADIVTLHVPLDDSTRHLLHHGNLRNFMLINTARGAVVDNRALLRAIDGERIGGTVLDVWENEPNISPELLDVVDLGTPHIAGYSLDGKVNGTRIIYEAVCKFFGIAPTWNPAPLMPAPVVPRIELSVSSGDDDEDVLHRVVKRIYDICADDAALRGNVQNFDKLRADYPIRRELSNTGLLLHGASDTLRQKFAALGFKMG